MLTQSNMYNMLYRPNPIQQKKNQFWSNKTVLYIYNIHIQMKTKYSTKEKSNTRQLISIINNHASSCPNRVQHLIKILKICYILSACLIYAPSRYTLYYIFNATTKQPIWSLLVSNTTLPPHGSQQKKTSFVRS